MDYEPVREFAAAFGPKVQTHEGRQELGKDISPIYFVTSAMPPTLIVQGDADKLVPLYQSRLFERKCREVGAPFKLIVKPGAGHGPDFGPVDQEMAMFNAWFDEHLFGGKIRE